MKFIIYNYYNKLILFVYITIKLNWLGQYYSILLILLMNGASRAPKFANGIIWQKKVYNVEIEDKINTYLT